MVISQSRIYEEFIWKEVGCWREVGSLNEVGSWNYVCQVGIRSCNKGGSWIQAGSLNELDV